jgi:glycerol-3-phosphate dehydrogenase
MRMNQAPMGDLASADLDVLVVGAGITGACIALEAARRGLRTGLVDRGDFGGGATANCLKIVHGGLRYLQNLDVPRLRASVAARSVWLRSAPHLVEPLPVLLPTYRGRFPPRVALAAALVVNEALSLDRNRGLVPGRQVPRARVLSRQECIALEPSVGVPGLTGGVLFHDALIYSPERLTLEVVEAARAAGAIVASYVEFDGPLMAGGRVAGARVRDRLGGDEAQLRTRWLVNATGSSVPTLAAQLASAAVPVSPAAVSRQAYSVALNFVTRQPAPQVAYAVRGGTGDAGGRRARQLFVVPWRGHAMVGTAHLEYRGDPSAFVLTPKLVAHFAEELAAAQPSLGDWAGDIALVHAGLLPLAGSPSGRGLRLLKRHRILDHAKDGCAGALSVVTVKLTTAGLVAGDVGYRLVPSRAVRRDDWRTLPLPGAAFDSLEALHVAARVRYGALLPADVLEHLVRSYGSRYEEILEYRHTLADWDQPAVAGAPVIRAQFVHGAVAEHARTAEDLVWRRTEIGPRGLADDAALRLAEAALAGAASPRAAPCLRDDLSTRAAPSLRDDPSTRTAPHPGDDAPTRAAR